MSMFHSQEIPHITEVLLKANKFEESIDFYKNVIGLDVIEKNDESAILGVDNDLMITLIKTDKPHTFNEGLYHIAFLLPSEKDLANWLVKQVNNKTNFIGASDHIVSKAMYLEDPNGFGIEVYADTDKSKWMKRNNQIHMDTLPLDIESLLALCDQSPIGKVKVGHLHLKQKDLVKAKDFYSRLGMDMMLDMGSAKFMSFGEYHHHLGINEWGKSYMNNHDEENGLQEMTIVYPKNEFNKITRERFVQLESITDSHYIAYDPVGIKIHMKTE